MGMPRELNLGNGLYIGESHPCFIIAEACENHLGSMETAKKMIEAAVACGADAIKFQHHLPDEEMLREAPISDNFAEPLYDILQRISLSLDQHYELKSYCDQQGILYCCTPFSLKAALEINELVPFFKIGSGELTDTPTLVEIAKLNKPMILSTGMATIEEIETTLKVVLPANSEVAILNCTSEYPPVYEDINIGLIPLLKEKFGVVVGHSDHTPENYTCFAAVASGASILEKHLILDLATNAPDANVSINPRGLAELVTGTRKIEAAMI